MNNRTEFLCDCPKTWAVWPPPKGQHQQQCIRYMAFLHNSTFRCIIHTWLSKTTPEIGLRSGYASCCTLEIMECLCKRNGQREVKFEISDLPVRQRRCAALSKLTSFVPAVFYTHLFLSKRGTWSQFLRDSIWGRFPTTGSCWDIFEIQQCTLIIIIDGVKKSWIINNLCVVCVFVF